MDLSLYKRVTTRTTWSYKDHHPPGMPLRVTSTPVPRMCARESPGCGAVPHLRRDQLPLSPQASPVRHTYNSRNVDNQYTPHFYSPGIDAYPLTPSPYSARSSPSPDVSFLSSSSSGIFSEDSNHESPVPSPLPPSSDTSLTSVPITNLTSEHGGDKPASVKPPATYITMIGRAILSAPEYKMILGDIYEFILEHYPFYRTAERTWKNAIRHNLSVNECFIKNGRADTGRGYYWSVHPACLEAFQQGDFRRREARRRCQIMNKECLELRAASQSMPSPVTTATTTQEAEVHFYMPMTPSHLPGHLQRYFDTYAASMAPGGAVAQYYEPDSGHVGLQTLPGSSVFQATYADLAYSQAAHMTRRSRDNV